MSPDKIMFFTILGAQGLGLLLVFVILPLFDKVNQLVLSRTAN